jgi:hypothetical protein
VSLKKLPAAIASGLKRLIFTRKWPANGFAVVAVKVTV